MCCVHVWLAYILSLNVLGLIIIPYAIYAHARDVHELTTTIIHHGFNIYTHMCPTNRNNR